MVTAKHLMDLRLQLGLNLQLIKEDGVNHRTHHCQSGALLVAPRQSSNGIDRQMLPLSRKYARRVGKVDFIPLPIRNERLKLFQVHTVVDDMKAAWLETGFFQTLASGI